MSNEKRLIQEDGFSYTTESCKMENRLVELIIKVYLEYLESGHKPIEITHVGTNALFRAETELLFAASMAKIKDSKE